MRLLSSRTASGFIDHMQVEKPWMPVWVVELEGKWHVFGGPPPGDIQLATETSYFDRCTAVIDFFTGSAFRIHAGTASASPDK